MKRGQKFKNFMALLVALCMLISVSACEKRHIEKGITISAAISLKEPLEKIAHRFEEKRGIKIYLNFGSSGSLQKQIEEGAPVDIFISASKEQMDRLEAKKLIDSSTRINILKNGLVLISPNSAEGIKSLEELKERKIALALGETNTVPLGQYAKESLQYLKLWDKVSSVIIYGKDASHVLKYVKNGEVQAGIVYESDTVTLGSNYNIIKLPESSHQEIIYPAAIITDSKDKNNAKAFIDFIRDNDNKSTFMKYKFSVEER